MPSGDTAHSRAWTGLTSRGQRLTRKLGGGAITLARLNDLLRAEK